MVPGAVTLTGLHDLINPIDARAQAKGGQPRGAISRVRRFAEDCTLEGDGFEPLVPLLRKALLGVANRRRRHERRSHLQVQVRNGNACLEWLPIAFPFAEGGTASPNPSSSTGESALHKLEGCRRAPRAFAAVFGQTVAGQIRKQEPG
jgi:hypothetical protein